MLKHQRLAAVTAMSVAAISFGATAQAETHAKVYTVLHDFAGPTGDGARPFSGVTSDSAGNLYGTTYDGGASNNGTIYKIAPGGSFTLLHSFDGAAGGAHPQAGVTIDKATGDLYGVTESGGNFAGECSGVGCGTLYKLAANGTFSVLHAFQGAPNDGRYPRWDMIRDRKGNLYGVTAAGGTLGYDRPASRPACTRPRRQSLRCSINGRHLARMQRARLRRGVQALAQRHLCYPLLLHQQ
jgi:uncharacterized repeat protein (TIGR03803 family)